MYACTYETDSGFSTGCMLSMIRSAFLLTHPHPAIRGSLHASPVSI
jgi:hypothetical protein